MRHNQMVLEQESQLNAPDPRENHPPCYEDAILLPRLDTSFASLKRAGLVSDEYDDTFRRAPKRARCRSEEVLCVRDVNVNKNRRHILAARIRRNQQQKSIPNSNDGKMKCENGEENQVNRQQQEQQQYKHEQYHQKPIDIKLQSFVSNESNFDLIDRLETVDGYSPYAKRKIKQNFELVVPVASTSAALLNQPNDENDNREIVIIENHYRSEHNLNTLDITKQQYAHLLMDAMEPYTVSRSTLSSSSLDSEDYSKLSSHENCSTKQSDI